MIKMTYISGENEVNVGENVSGIGTSANPLVYTGDYQHVDKRILLWESTGNDYETDIQLSQPITDFDQIMIYGSGLELDDTYHLSKNVYNVQTDVINGCDIWGYSPWSTAFQANYILGASLKLSGDSGHIGSSYYWGIGSKNATWAAGKWTGTEAPKMLMPWKIFGIKNNSKIYYAKISGDSGGNLSLNNNSGYTNTEISIIKTPDEGKFFSGYDVYGAQINYDKFKFTDKNVSIYGKWSNSPVIRNITLETEGSGTLEADATSGYSYDLIHLTAAPVNDNYMLTNLDISGAELSGDEFYLQYSDVNIKAIFDLASGLIYSSTDATTAGVATYCDVTLPDSGNYYVFYIDYKAYVDGAGGRHYRFNKSWDWYCRQHYRVGSPCTIKNGAFTDVNSTVMGNSTVDSSVIHYAKNTNVGNFSAYKIIVDKTNSNTSAYLNNEYCGSAVCNSGLQLTSMKMDATNELRNGNTGKNCKVAWFGSFDKALEWVG